MAEIPKVVFSTTLKPPLTWDNTDLVAQDLRGDLQLGVSNEACHLFGNRPFDALLNFDGLPGMT